MDQIYVVTKEEVNSSYINKVWTYTTPTILGFAARYDINSDKCNKKNKEQDDWVEREVYNNNGQPTIWAWNYITQKMEYIPFHPKAPLMLDNDPTMGFTIAGYATRSSTSNKLWRILDPRGFQLEISTDNMLDIITNGHLVIGDILGAYKWDFGKQGIGKVKLIKC